MNGTELELEEKHVALAISLGLCSVVVDIEPEDGKASIRFLVGLSL